MGPMSNLGWQDRRPASVDDPDYRMFDNSSGLADDMKLLAIMPELCDVTFLVGDNREPVFAAKAVLAARSRVFQKMLYPIMSPQRKKEPLTRENKIRMFLKFSSEPVLSLQDTAQQPQFSGHQTIIIDEFEPDVFRQMIEYVHTGSVTLEPRTLFGLISAANYYGLEELKEACEAYIKRCINVDTVCVLLATRKRYIQYKCTKPFVDEVLKFIDEHGEEVLNLGSFTLLPQYVVQLILSREGLHVDEFTKFKAVLTWCKKYCETKQNASLKDTLNNFTEYIQFHKIPATSLMQEVNPLIEQMPEIIRTVLAEAKPKRLSLPRIKKQGMSIRSDPNLYGNNTLSLSANVGSIRKGHSCGE